MLCFLLSPLLVSALTLLSFSFFLSLSPKCPLLSLYSPLLHLYLPPYIHTYVNHAHTQARCVHVMRDAYACTYMSVYAHKARMRECSHACITHTQAHRCITHACISRTHKHDARMHTYQRNCSMCIHFIRHTRMHAYAMIYVMHAYAMIYVDIRDDIRG